MVDTGSQHSYITDELYERLNSPKYSSTTRKVEFANGDTAIVKDYTDIEFTINDNNTDILQLQTGILKGSKQEIILGLDFMRRYNIKINFKNKE
ncbi:hypothetical protein H311_02031, partial [Anncaliia algerae PRA109]